ncbi:hypothetical protein PEP31012_04659 [Pandoraea eparura]|jgi:hypothetical protein|uniref:Transmembrane protein n=1 Tax=Pandoraea eparura TaxID=2508291 RepID=A0A5E4YMM1_9BURK|nr:hypothetical protein [Pandoraea eparura]VVE50094.1 hypothetical protein PEP31012_04659 [Pandoraea eparura]
MIVPHLSNGELMTMFAIAVFGAVVVGAMPCKGAIRLCWRSLLVVVGAVLAVLAFELVPLLG